MRKAKFSLLGTAAVAVVSILLTACGGGAATNSNTAGGVDPNETAATVNGKAIKLVEIERALKEQMQGQESRLSDLELAAARLQILETLIQQEVMFQKAEKEGTVPTPEDVTAEYNKRRTESGMSKEQWEEMMKKIGQTDETARESIRRSLAITKLIDKVTGKIEPPKDSEIENFYNGNKEAFVKKKGAKLAAIVIDPANNGEGDTTIDEQSAVLRGNEIIKQLQQGIEFTTLVREKSEDQSKFRDGDLGYIAEEQMRQQFPPQVAATLMNPEFKVGQIIPAQIQGKYYILKLQERSDKDENLTLESPGVRQRVTEELTNSRKQLLAASFQAIAMNEAKIVNYLAQKVVDNPNELSGARPAGAETPAANANSNTAPAANATANSKPANANSNTKPANANSNTKPANANSKPAGK